MNNENSTVCLLCALLDSNHPSVIAFQGLLGLVSSINNIVAVIALVKTENIKPNLKLLLIVLTVTDALSGIAFIYHSFALYFIYYNKLECSIRYFLVAILCALSMMIVLTMTLERLFAIFLPLRYNQILTRTKLVTFMVLQSSLALMLAILGLFYESNEFVFCSYLNINSSETYLIHGIPIMSTLVFTFIGNLVIYCAARSHIKAIVHPKWNEDNMENKMNIKATLTTLAVVVPFLISYLPLGIFCFYMYFNPEYRTVLTSYHYLNGIFSLTIINGIINPLVYSWRLPELRLSLKRLLKMH